MACNDMCGRQVLEACGAAGVRVPGHVAVVGVDNDELMCELCEPSLSSVALDLERAGYQAAHLLDEIMLAELKQQRHIVPVKPLWVVTRRSSDLIIKDDLLVGEALRFIKDHAAQNIGVPDVVQQLGVSRRTLERHFFKAIGSSILTAINRYRLDRAKGLLHETGLPAYRIASEAGFANVRMFKRIFRRAERCSPETFRQQLGR